MDSPPQLMINYAIAAALQSPCAKTKRGAVIFRWGAPWSIYGVGFNHPPAGIGCTESGWCRESCSKRCVHAEAHALASCDPLAMKDVDGVELVHVKVVDGKLVPSGGPRCWQCARDLLEDARVAGVWLYHASPVAGEDATWRRYKTIEFYNSTMRVCGLPEYVAP